MGQGEKGNYRMFLWLLSKTLTGPEFTFHLTFDKCSAKTNNSSIQFVYYADKPKTKAALKLMKLRSCKD